jgi:hypothetical protein
MTASPGHPSNVRAGFFTRFGFAAIRRLERALSPDAFYQLIALSFRARRADKRPFPPLPLPACLQHEGQQFISVREKRRRDYFNRVLEFLPDQLSSPKWRDRVEFEGLDHLASARKNKKPVVLAFCHFGPFFLLRPWLRASGFPTAALSRGSAENHPPWKRLRDAVSPFPEIPMNFYQDQLRELVEFLESGHPLLIALDVELGKQLQVPFDDQHHLRVASGPLRLAIRHHAELIPCIITDRGGWRFRIKLGPPVPSEFLRAGQEAQAVKKWAQALLPELRAHPEQCVQRVLNLFQPAAPPNNFANPLAYVDPIAAG